MSINNFTHCNFVAPKKQWKQCLCVVVCPVGLSAEVCSYRQNLRAGQLNAVDDALTLLCPTDIGPDEALEANKSGRC